MCSYCTCLQCMFVHIVLKCIAILIFAMYMYVCTYVLFFYCQLIFNLAIWTYTLSTLKLASQNYHQRWARALYDVWFWGIAFQFWYTYVCYARTATEELSWRWTVSCWWWCPSPHHPHTPHTRHSPHSTHLHLCSLSLFTTWAGEYYIHTCMYTCYNCNLQSHKPCELFYFDL